VASGPLSGVKVIEFAGLGPAPFCGMLLSDMGAELLRVDRKNARKADFHPDFDLMSRGRRSIGLDLKTSQGVDACLRLVSQADMLLEGFRPGVMERLGLGPEVCVNRNPKLVYGRMTGWGQTGPLSKSAGHDINYISLTGALHAIGPKGGKPVPPLALVGDLGGGGLYLALGMVAALFEAGRSGKGQVIDAAIVDGAASLMTASFDMLASGVFPAERGTGMVDGGAPFYDVYETRDGKYVSIASIEPQFYDLLRKALGLDEELFDEQLDRTRWPLQKSKLETLFKTKTQAEWCSVLEGTDVCFAPVLPLDQVKDHPHNEERKTYVEVDGVLQPNVAPRFSRTASRIQGPAPKLGAHTLDILRASGFSESEINDLRKAGAI
jgi:alpha-methylacyl-CoA racemase